MKRMTESLAAWIRGLVWTAMILGCAWASAQSYLVTPAGRYTVVSMGAGPGAAEGAGQNGDVKDDLFAGTEDLAKNATHVTEITMDPDSLNMVGGHDSAKAHNMVLNVVRTYEYDKPGMYNMADVDAIRSKLNTGDWHCSVHVRDLKTGDGQDICSKHRTDGLREEAIIEVEPKELTLIHRIWRPNGPGSSELGYFPMLPGLGPMAMMAMTNPDAMINMEMARPVVDGMPLILDMEPGLALQMHELKVRPFDEKQMKEFNEQFKNMKVKPLDEKQLKDLNQQMEKMKIEIQPLTEGPEAAPAPDVAPAAPDGARVVPDVAPAPQAPATPSVPPAPQPE